VNVSQVVCFDFKLSAPVAAFSQRVYRNQRAVFFTTVNEQSTVNSNFDFHERPSRFRNCGLLALSLPDELRRQHLPQSFDTTVPLPAYPKTGAALQHSQMDSPLICSGTGADN